MECGGLTPLLTGPLDNGLNHRDTENTERDRSDKARSNAAFCDLISLIAFVQSLRSACEPAAYIYG
jgi:hypothetical protein